MSNKCIIELVNIFEYILDSLKRKSNYYKINSNKADEIEVNEAKTKLDSINNIIDKLEKEKDIFALLEIDKFLLQKNSKDLFSTYDTKVYDHILKLVGLYSDQISKDIGLEISSMNIDVILSNPLIKKVIYYLDSTRERLFNYILNYKIINEELPYVIETLRNLKENEPISREIIKYIEKVIDDVGDEISSFDKLEIQMLIMEYNTLVFENKFSLIKKNVSYQLNKTKIKNLFADFGYNFAEFENYSDEIITYSNYSELEKILSFFNEKDLPIDEKSIYVLIHSNYSNLVNIYNVVGDSKKDLLEIIEKTPSAFINGDSDLARDSSETILKKIKRKKNNGSYEDFISNVKLLDSLGFKFSDYYTLYPTVYTFNHMKLSKNIIDLKKYGYDLSLVDKKEFNLSCLKAPSLLDTIDQSIELECLDYFLNNTSRFILGPSALLFYRLYYVKKYNLIHSDEPISIYSSRNGEKRKLRSLITVSSNNTLGVDNKNKVQKTNTIKPVITEADDQISEFLHDHDTYINETVINDPLIKKLDKLALNPEKDYIYNFGNKRISRFKVLRIYGSIKNKFSMDSSSLLLYAICYNSIINEEEYNLIKNYVLSLSYEKGRK